MLSCRRDQAREGGWNTDVINIGRCRIGRNSLSIRRRSGLSSSGNGERAEKSSERGSDSTSMSEFNRPRRVNGAPSICASTQTQSSTTTHAKLVGRHEEHAAILPIANILIHIPHGSGFVICLGNGGAMMLPCDTPAEEQFKSFADPTKHRLLQNRDPPPPLG